MNKSFWQSKKMVAAFVVTVSSNFTSLVFLLASLKQPDVINATVMQLVVLTYGGAFAAAWASAITTQGIVGDKQAGQLALADSARTAVKIGNPGALLEIPKNGD